MNFGDWARKELRLVVPVGVDMVIASVYHDFYHIGFRRICIGVTHVVREI